MTRRIFLVTFHCNHTIEAGLVAKGVAGVGNKPEPL